MAVDWGQVGLQTTPTAGALYQSSGLAAAEKGYASALAAKTGYAERSLAASYGQAFKEVERRMERLAARMQAEMAKGNYSPSWTMQQDRYRSLLNQYAAAVRTFNAATVAQINSVHQEGVKAALAHTPTQVRDYMGGTAPTGVTLPDFGPETWGTLNKAAYEKAVGYLNQQGAPLRDLIQQLGTDTLHAVQTEWAKGMALGYNPNKIARNIKNATANIALGRAKTIARTEFHRAYRQTKAEQIDASDVTAGWVWKANLDSGTCGLCVAMGGSVHPKGDVLDSHPNCRCSMVPLTKTWDELGFPGVPGDRPAALNTPSGPMWIANQGPAAIQRAFGKARGQDFIDRLAAGQHPTSIARSYVGQTSNPTWGPMKRLTPWGGGTMPKATGPAPVAPPLPVKPPPAPKPAPLPKAVPKVTLPGPLAAVSAKVHTPGGFFDKATKAAKAAQTKLGREWLTRTHGLGGFGPQQAKADIAGTLAKMSESEYNAALRTWDGRWPDYKSMGGQMIPSGGGYAYSYRLPKDWEFMTVAERDAFLATSEGVMLREHLASNMVQTWAGTSADNNPLSLLAQQRAEIKFGMQTDTSHLSSQSGWQAALAAPPAMVRIMDSTLDSMYKNTQAQFAAEGIKTIKLTRGQGWRVGRPQWVENLGPGESAVGQTRLQPMSSFSSSKAIATRFATGYPSYYITADFPVEWIIGTARTGFGCLHEAEFVVMGGRPITAQITRRR